MKKKTIQIFYGGFKFVKGGVNSHSKSIADVFKKNYNVQLITLDNLSIFIRFLPHIVEKIVNYFSLPMGFYYKGLCTKILFKFFFNHKCDYRIFEDIYISWNSNVPSLTILHAVWSDNLQKFKIKYKNLQKLKNKELQIINHIKHPVSTVSEPYKKYIMHKHFSKRIQKKILVTELGISKEFNKLKKTNKSKNKIIYVGSLEARKNVFFLLRLFRKIYKFDNRYKLTIVGDGPDRNDLESFKKKYNLPINFTGNLSNKQISREMKNNHFYIHTSIKESFSLSLLEAKLSGLVTVAYDKLEVPNEFIDIKVKDFNVNTWFYEIVKRKKLSQEKVNIKKYEIENSAKKIFNEVKISDFESKDLLSNLNLEILNKTKKKFNLPNKFLLSVCEFINENNFLIILDALKILINRNIDISLVITVRDSSNIKKLKFLVKQKKLTSHITIVNNNNYLELLCFYKLATIFLNLTSSVKFDLKILSDISLNLPIILCDHNHIREITKNKFNYYNVKDSLSLADRVNFLLN